MALLVTPAFAILVFIAVIIISAIAAWWIGKYANYDTGSFHVFIAVLTGLGVVITFMFYYNLVELNAQQQRLATIQELSRINNTVLSALLKDMNDAAVIVPNFVLSITPLSNAVCCGEAFTGGTGDSQGSEIPGTCVIPTGPDPVTAPACTQKMVLSYRIFGLWQDFIISKAEININAMPYVANFLQRANSLQLYDQWTAAKLDFTPNTQTFGALLFQYGLPISQQTPASYEEAAVKLLADPVYQKI